MGCLFCVGAYYPNFTECFSLFLFVFLCGISFLCSMLFLYGIFIYGMCLSYYSNSTKAHAQAIHNVGLVA